MPLVDANTRLAVLASGGLDSAILLGSLKANPVVPLYIRCGLFYEPVEIEYLQRFLEAIRRPGLADLQILDMPVRDLYGDHWSITGREVPDAQSPDSAVFLPGRNVLLLAKGMLWCHLHQVDAIALGMLQSNPFPDATPAFFSSFQDVVNRAVEGRVQVRLPFAKMKKTDVMHLERDLPLEYTFSCIQPQNGLHCGKCNKCAERRNAFVAAGMCDPTTYA